MVDNNWTNFDKSVIPGRLDGLKIQTDASKPYYITYRTHNQGQGTYYPFVQAVKTITQVLPANQFSCSACMHTEMTVRNYLQVL